MKKNIISGFLFFMLLYSCSVNKTMNEEKINGINLDANYRTNNEIKLIYNSIDTISTILIINKQKIEKSKIKSILDTLKKQNYFINVDKEKRIIEMIKK